MKYVAYKNDFKGLLKNDVILIASNENLSCEDILETLSPELNAFIVDEADLPDKTDTAHLWEIVNNKIQYDINRAREATKNKLRGERNSLLSDLDVKFMKALEGGLPTTEIVAEKQRLRDITSKVDDIFDIEEMKKMNCNP